MWPFNKKTLVQQGLFHGFTDNHSHILPGVDDGVKTMEESLAILSEYESLGVREVWLTPHVQEYMPNTTEKLQARFQELKEAYTGNITLHLAAEYMLDTLFEERLKAKDLLCHSLPGAEPQLLVETSYFNPPMSFWSLVSDVMSSGIRPILAHPERYLYMSDEDYSRLHDMGVLMQMNIPSILGAYGGEVRNRAKKLLSLGYYSLYGTDIHRKDLLDIINDKKVNVKLPSSM